MKRIIKHTKIISVVSIVVILLSLSSAISISAGVILVNESESNNTMATADMTYNDHDAIGTMSSLTDIDWWKFTPTTTGRVNIWLGNIPSGHNYDIALHSADGTYMARSTQTTGNQELMKCRLVRGNTYYVKVVTKAGYSTSLQYTLRVKRYDLGNANMFVYNLKNTDGSLYINTTPSTASFTYINNMEYNGTYYTNHVANSVFLTMPQSTVFVTRAHSSPGIVECASTINNSTCLVANTYNGMPENYRSLSQYAAGDLSNVQLAIFMGCHTGETDTSSQNRGNLVTMARNKGVFCSFGWEGNINSSAANEWIIEFFYRCSLNDNILNAAKAADNYVKTYHYEYSYNLSERFFGTSRPESTII